MYNNIRDNPIEWKPEKVEAPKLSSAASPKGGGKGGTGGSKSSGVLEENRKSLDHIVRKALGHLRTQLHLQSTWRPCNLSSIVHAIFSTTWFKFMIAITGTHRNNTRTGSCSRTAPAPPQPFIIHRINPSHTYYLS
jgi:hypothetical protein